MSLVGAERTKRDYNRYDRLCVQCMRMVRCKNLARHIREQHPQGFEGQFVPCLVSSNHLRNITSRHPPNCTFGETQTIITVPPKANLYGQLQYWTQTDFANIIQLILYQARSGCFTCLMNIEIAGLNNDQFYFEPNFIYADHVDGCKAPAHMLIARYLPDILRSAGIEEVGEVVIATHYISKLVERECQWLGQ